MSLISPPPIPLPLVIKYNKYKKPLTHIAPITYSYQCDKSVSNFIMPKTPMKTLKANGISKVLKSITLRANKEEKHNQYKILTKSNPLIRIIIAYPIPFKNSISGY